MPSALYMLYQLLSGQISSEPGVEIVADDGQTLLSPNITVPNSSLQNNLDSMPNSTAGLILVATNPYAQEGQGEMPQVIVGPASPVRSQPLSGGFANDTEVKVEVRVLARNWDASDLGFKLNGDITRRKLVDSVTQVVKRNRSNPDRLGNFAAVWVSDPGDDKDAPGEPYLYKTAMAVNVLYLT